MDLARARETMKQYKFKWGNDFRIGSIKFCVGAKFEAIRMCALKFRICPTTFLPASFQSSASPNNH